MTMQGMVPGIPGAIWRQCSESDLPVRLAGALDAGPGVAATEDRLLFALPGIARYLVAQGRAIDFAPHTTADNEAVHLFLHGSARGVLIQQRGELALEAATLKSRDGRCVAIAGHPGAGKSTLAAVLCRRGWRLVADDITRVTWNGTSAIAWPSDRAVQLWRDACERLGFDRAGLKQARNGLERYHVPVNACAEPTILTHIVRLRVVQGPRLTACAASERPGVTTAISFKPHLPAFFGARQRHKLILECVAAACPVYELEGARECAVDALADQIEGGLQ